MAVRFPNRGISRVEDFPRHVLECIGDRVPLDVDPRRRDNLPSRWRDHEINRSFLSRCHFT